MTAAAAAPAWLAEVAKAVDTRLEALLDAEVARWAGFEPDLEPPLDALRSFVLGGGKRLRPAFCSWGFVGTGGDPTDPLWVDAGAALELLHCFALVHDDVMDGSATRRGLPTVHVAFERRHRAAGWRGEGRRFGEGAAILVGDIAFVLADRLLGGAPRPAWEVWDELRLEVNVGQYLDMLHTATAAPTVESAQRICTYKTAKDPVERPLHLGAALTGAVDDLTRAALSGYGLSLGEAFQLVDDLLGAFGDPRRTGKPVGDDLREGKPTLLLALALERSSGAELDLLGSRVGADDLSDDEVLAILGVLESTGARAEVEAAVANLAATALQRASELPLTGEARAALGEIAAFIVGRDH
ncbi:MAG: polyprenyl synthetase family protein [Acidimicrobiia bacterium]